MQTHIVQRNHCDRITHINVSNISLSLLTGSFFDSLPPSDLYTMCHVLHNWSDEECVSILNNAYDHLQPGKSQSNVSPLYTHYRHHCIYLYRPVYLRLLSLSLPLPMLRVKHTNRVNLNVYIMENTYLRNNSYI